MRGLLIGILAVAVSGSVLAKGGKYDSFVAQAKAELTKNFKDPDSALFRNLAVYQGLGDDKPLSLCGEVNAKNSFGAYVGYVEFYANAKSSTMKEEGDTVLFPMLKVASCDKRLAPAK